ncbi:MAG TPA: hypothetical protein VFE50_22245 [Cyclobacteriaceae bacterium]|nr:hypothetical protein [Cyclobacteriaceae bacterium]
MKKGSDTNKFDTLVTRLAQEFSKIPNFSLTSEDETAKKLFSLIAFRLADISSYADLVYSHFIPSTNKAIADAKKDFIQSQYRHLLKNQNLDFEETLFDTVRLAYVGLFHKLENFMNDLVKLPEMVFSELYETNEPAIKLAKDKYGFDFRDWQQFQITHKINWICNCVKHKDGFPIKQPKPIQFQD